MHDNKSNKNLFGCVCVFEFSPHFSLYSCDWNERANIRTHARTPVRLLCFRCSRSISLPFFIHIVAQIQWKYIHRAFIRYGFVCVYISRFFWPPKKRTSQSRTHTHTIRIQHNLIQNQTPRKQIRRILDLYFDTSDEIRRHPCSIVDGSNVFLYCNDNPPPKNKSKNTIVSVVPHLFA